jgi:2-phospho-L-lactate/phosphoenolpyruvate guanylyltransferase
LELLVAGRLQQADAYHPSVIDASVGDLSVVHVVVPLRGAESGKSRLGGALDAEERGALVLGLLERTLAVLDAWPVARRVHLVTADAGAAAMVRKARPLLNVLAEPTGGGLNAALRVAVAAAAASGATALMMLPADLPLLEVAALDSMLDAADAALAAGEGRAVVVIAPADARGGTNALLLSPIDVIEPQFGEASLEAHLRAAQAAGTSVQLVHEVGLGFDLDTPDDLERLEAETLLAIEHLGQALLAGRATAEVA